MVKFRDIISMLLTHGAALPMPRNYLSKNYGESVEITCLETNALYIAKSHEVCNPGMRMAIVAFLFSKKGMQR